MGALENWRSRGIGRGARRWVVLVAVAAGLAIYCVPTASIDNLSQNDLATSTQPGFSAGTLHVRSNFWWLAPGDTVPIRVRSWNVTMHDTVGRSGSFDLCGPAGQIRIGEPGNSYRPVFARGLLLRLLEFPGPAFDTANPPVDFESNVRDCEGNGSLHEFAPTGDARLELHGIVGDSETIGEPPLDLAVVPSGATRTMEPRRMVFVSCSERDPGGLCTNASWHAPMSLTPINWSPNLKIQKVRVLRGPTAPGPPAGTEGRALTTTFSGMAPVALHSIEPASGTSVKCYPHPSGPKTDVDFGVCCRDRACNSAAPQIITPGYLDGAVDSVLTWEIDFKTSSGTPPPEVAVDANGVPRDSSDTLAIEFTLEPR